VAQAVRVSIPSAAGRCGRTSRKGRDKWGTVQAAISVTVSMRANCWFGCLPQRPCRASSPAHESTDLQTNFCVLRLECRNGRSYSTGRCTQDWMADRNASSHTRRLVTRTAQEDRPLAGRSL